MKREVNNLTWVSYIQVEDTLRNWIRIENCKAKHKK